MKIKEVIIIFSTLVLVSIGWNFLLIFTSLSRFYNQRYLERIYEKEIEDGNADFMTYAKLSEIYRDKLEFNRDLHLWLKEYKGDTTKPEYIYSLASIYRILYKTDTTRLEYRKKALKYTELLVKFSKEEINYLRVAVILFEDLGEKEKAKEIYQQLYSHFRGDTLLIIDKMTKSQVEEKLKELSKNKK